jgi:hypothetical protein
MWDTVRTAWDTLTDWALYLYGQFTFYFLSYNEG